MQYQRIKMYRFKKTCTTSKKSVPVQKKLELVQIQIVPKDKLNYNIYFPAMLLWPNESYYVANTFFL